jgi:hypothetical protein
MDQDNTAPGNEETVRALVRQVLNESDVILASKYTDEDAKALGLPTPGQMNLMNRVVKQLEGTPFVPKWIAETQNPGGTLLAVMLRGRSLGFAPMACPDIFWKDPAGRLAMWGRNLLAVIYQHAQKVEFREESDDMCRVWAMRKDGVNDYEARFSHDDAVLAGLVDKNQSLHKKYPRRMLKWRAVSDLANTLFQDVFIGGIVTREEAEEDARNGLVGDGSSQMFAQHAKETANQFTVGEIPVGEVIDVKAEPAEPVKDKVVEMPRPATVTEPDKPVTAPAAAPTPAPDPAPAAAPVKSPEPPKAETKGESKAAEEKPEAKLVSRMNGLADLVKTASPNTVQMRVSTWMKNFLNVKTLPKGPDHHVIYGRMLDIVEPCLKADPSKIMDHPLESGLQCGVGYREFLKLLESWIWSDRCKEAAFDLAVAYAYPYVAGGPNHSWSKDFEEFMVALQIPDLTETEIWTFLRVGLRTRLAHMLVQQAGLTATPMSKIVQGWGIDVETAPVDGIEALLIGGLKKAEADNPDSDSEPLATQQPAPAESAAAANGSGVKEEIQDILDMFS